MTGIPVIPIVTLGIAAGLLASAYKNVKRRELLHRERMALIEKGHPSTPELLKTLKETDDVPRSNGLALHGLIWLAIGGGLLVGSYLALPGGTSSNFRTLHEMNMASVRIWAYPALFVGVALLMYAGFGWVRCKRRGVSPSLTPEPSGAQDTDADTEGRS